MKKKKKKKTTRVEQHEPSAASLRAIPEVRDFAKAKLNPYATRIAIEGIELQIGPHRPKVGKEVGTTETRTVRFPPQVWRAVERVAKRERLNLHAAMRLAIVEWVQRREVDSASEERDVTPARSRVSG
jgi:hypothetical protein